MKEAGAREKHREQCLGFLEQAGITLTEQEREGLELADMGLGHFQREGLGLVVYVNNDRYCAKELVLLPRQTCPEHRHPPVFEDDRPIDSGKTETFRCRWGTVYLYVEGEGSRERMKARLPEGSESHYSVFHEIELRPGDQYTIPPNTLHWFQAGDDGTVVSEFSSRSRDELDVFSDPRIKRMAD